MIKSPSDKFEKIERSKGHKWIAGIDEAGRGPLAGPVAAAACIIPQGIKIKGVNDSKLCSPELREELYHTITTNPAIVYSVALIDALVIDQVNIYQATILAMLKAIAGLSLPPDSILVDGLALPHPTIPCVKIIRGDQQSHSIAAASILAKVTRDRLMLEYHEQWPEYGFNQHKGYATKGHREAIQRLGPCPIHRLSFEPFVSN